MPKTLHHVQNKIFRTVNPIILTDDDGIKIFLINFKIQFKN